MSVPTLATVPPESVKSPPTVKLPALFTGAGLLLPYCKPNGTFTCNNGGAWGLVALNSLPSENLILVAVLALKEPATSSLALLPKITPLGLIKYKFAVPFVLNVPSISEIFAPVTRPITLVVVSALSKWAVFAVGTEKS